MKRMLVFGIVMVAGIGLMAQVKKKPVTPAKPAQTLSMKTNEDSLSYAIGFSAANFFKQQNVKNINTALVNKAIQDVLKSGTPVLNEQEVNAVIMSCVNKAQAEKNKETLAIAEANKKTGEAFLAANKSKPGVVTLPSGLQYEILTEGKGPKPAATDKVRCHYQGTLLDGTIFDSSIQRGQPLEIEVNHVIPGWTEALQLMPVGSKWRLYIPSQLAYGDRQAGESIKPGSTLIFDVDLIDIVK
jgi:FKBP-type peptidyl-prolyl cis-trans isomerase FklB